MLHAENSCAVGRQAALGLGLPRGTGSAASGPSRRPAGPCETRFCRVPALFLQEELNPFLWALTADPHCSEAALRQLKETLPHSGRPATNGHPSIAPGFPDPAGGIARGPGAPCRGGPPPHSSTVAGCGACTPGPDGWIHRDPTGPFTRAPPGHAVHTRRRSRALGTVRCAPRLRRTVLQGDGRALGTSYEAELYRLPALLRGL
jgi:hypothetical protein